MMRSNKGIKIILNIFITVIAVVTIFGYAYFKTQAYLQGPQMTINTPLNGSTVTEPQLAIQGLVERVSSIHLNGRKIFIDKEGHFKEHILLYPGHNIITVEATDRFDKRIKKRVEVIYRETHLDT